ncbi:MAG TPA: ATP-binding protein [Candidatus Aphodousia faecavium]|nr:ATP-binding protein [Candidatus Aphodousia faecavium]
MIFHELTSRILDSTPPKAVVIYGPRQAGKTTLIKNLPNLGVVNFLNADRPRDVRQLQGLQSAGDIDVLLSSSDTIIIDEAQNVPDIGHIVKMLVDANQKTKIFLTGSSALELAQGVRESAVGRVVHRNLWPLSIHELANEYGWGYVQTNLDRFLVYGTYPATVTNPDTAVEQLIDLSGDLLFRDVLALQDVRSPNTLRQLLELLAYRIGQEISYESLGREIRMHSQTVERYIDILEKCFIIKRCGSFAKNLDNEIKKGKKIYFCDVGLRNAIIDDFSPFGTREDAGHLWENFFFMERLKKHDLERSFVRQYFWRIRGKRIRQSSGHESEYSREIDLVEVRNQNMQAFECKLNPRQKDNGGKEFRSAYPNCPINVVSPENLDPSLF